MNRHGITAALKTYFGYSSFKPNQEEIVRAILKGRDVFAAMPTGGGKSLCYQLPAVLSGGITVVVSPLIALMKDQVDDACENGIESAYINSTLSDKEAVRVYRDMYGGKLKLLYVAPERLITGGFLERLGDAGVGHFAIDEAHCISEWGYDFRPDYRMLAGLRKKFPDVNISAFTATATRKVQEDIIRLLKLKDPLEIRASFDRKELFYRVVRKDGVQGQVLDFVRDRPGQAGIVYRATRKDVETTAEYLRKHGVRALPYHAGFPPETRKKNQDLFRFGDTDVIVATIAFGMGIDAANIRFVVHADLPKSIESYYQETGRAGRDGDRADCLLLYAPGDTAKIRYHIRNMKDEKEKKRAGANLRKMASYAETGVCRRKQLLSYFDEDHDGSCGMCDICNGETKRVDGTEDSRKLLSALARTGERFGAGYIIDIVKGAKTERIRRYRHDTLPTYGVGKDKSRQHWQRLMDELVARGHVSRDDANYGILKMEKSGKDVLFGRLEVTMTERHVPEKGKKHLQDRPVDERLLRMLKDLRKEIAGKKRVPPYVVFSDKTLKDMCGKMPRTEEEFLLIHGVGRVKLKSYGHVFLGLIGQYHE